MEENEGYTEEEVEQLVERFKEMTSTGEMRYIEDEDMEVIIESLIGKMDFPWATKAVNYALQMFPSSEVFHLLKVRKLMMELNLDSASRELDKIEETFPPSAELYLEKAFLSKLTGADDDSFPLLKKAYRLDPENPEINLMLSSEYVRKGNYEKGYHLLKNAMESDEIIEEQLFTFSYIFEENKLYDDAISFFLQLTEDFPLSKSSWFALGLAYSWKKEFTNAIDAYLNAISLDEEASTAYFNVGNAYFEMKDYAEALHYYQETIRLDDQDFHAMSGIGDCYYAMEEYDKALDSYHQALILNSDTTDALMGIINILHETGRNEEAESFIRKTISLQPRSFELLFDLLPFYKEEEQLERLKEFFNLTISQLENKQEFLFFFTLYCCNTEGTRAMGIQLLEEYLDDEEVALSIPYFLAAMNYLEGDYGRAHNFLSTALLINYEGHDQFLALHPDLANIEDVQKLISSYR